MSYSKGVNIPHKALDLISNHRDPTLMTMLYLLQQLLKKRIDLSIRQEGAKHLYHKKLNFCNQIKFYKNGRTRQMVYKNNT